MATQSSKTRKARLTSRTKALPTKDLGCDIPSLHDDERAPHRLTRYRGLDGGWV